MVRIRRESHFSDLWPTDEGGRLLGGALLLVWGLSLAVSGLGIQHGPIAAAFQLYWPLPFVVWGALGFIWHLARGTPGMAFYLIVAALAALVEADTLHVAHVAVGTLFAAVLLVGFGLSFLRHLGHRGGYRS
jgi:hypothetical protein